MRVVFTGPNAGSSVTGPARVIDAVASHLAAKGHEILVLGLRAGNAPGASSRIERLATPAAGVRRELDRWKPDLVVAHEVRNPLTRAAVRWTRRNGVRCAIQPHGGIGAISRVPAWWQRAVYAAYDMGPDRLLRSPREPLIVSSRAEREAAVRAVGERETVTLYHGCDVEYQPRRTGTGSPLHVLMLGNFGIFRDPRWAIEACDIVRRRGLDVDLTIAGPLQEQSRLARRIPSGFPGATRRLGLVSSAERLRLLAEADVFCYPSRYESFGLPILEAAVAGVPIVAPAVGIAPELGLDGEAGVLARSHRPQDIATGLESVARRLDGFRRASKALSQRLRPWARWDRRADAYRTWVESGRAPEDSPPRH